MIGSFDHANEHRSKGKQWLPVAVAIKIENPPEKRRKARAEIVGPQVKYLTPDSTLKLICRVVQSTEASAFIFWYHNNRMINYDLDRGINVSTEAVLHLGPAGPDRNRREQFM
uniref:Ig-like domain-containing protein n=1 Tax=Anopheles minimus TaxID=112268 RepID=A0A182WM82_9DIPT